MKNLILLFTFLATSFLSNAQAVLTTENFNKENFSCIKADYDYSQDAVETALTAKLAQLGYTAKEDKGLFSKTKGARRYTNAVIYSISKDMFDYVFFVDSKSKRENSSAIITMFIFKNNKSVLVKDDDMNLKAQSFLNKLLPDVVAADLEIKINAQQEKVNDAKKKLSSLQSDEQSLLKKIAKLQEEVANTKQSQVQTQTVLDAHQKILDDLIQRRLPKTN